jgi:hypothetical protein
MGHDVASSQVKPYAWPGNFGDIDLSEGVELGARVQISGVDQIYLQFYACLGWWSADGVTVECDASAALETDNNAFIGALSGKLKVLGQDEFEIESSVRQIYTLETVLPNNPESCLNTVEAMVLKWVDLWGKVGGLEAILPRHVQE